jgi:hypothetical protein
MPVSDVIAVNISVSAAGPTRAGFGEPLIAAMTCPFATGIVREYTSLAGMISDGFLVTNPAYLCAAEVFAQTPSPTALKIAKRALPNTQVTKLTLLSVNTTDVYVLKLRTPGGSYQTVSFTSTGVPATDVATMNTAVTALAIPNLTATHATTILTLTMTAGNLLDVAPGSATLMTFQDTTPDPGIATDLANILTVDSNWYGLLLDSNSALEITAAAAWAESNGKLYGYNNTDSGCMNAASTTDIFYTEKQLAHTRSFGIFAQTTLLSYSAAAWMGRLFPTDAGSENWAFKTLSGVPTDVLTDTQVHAVENKNASVYTALFGLPLTQFGKTPSGGFIDTKRGTDSLTNDLQVAVVALQANTKKVPFTDAGIDMYRTVISGVLKQYTDIGFLAASPAFFVGLPLAAAVDPTNRINRNLPLAFFTANLAGAINSTTLTGTLTA